MKQRKRPHMRKAQQYLNFISTLHDLLLIISRCSPSLNAFKKVLSSEVSVYCWLDTLRAMKCIKLTRMRLAGQWVVKLSLTEKGYTYRGIP